MRSTRTESSSPVCITPQLANSYHEAFENRSTFNRLPTELVTDIFKQSISTPTLYTSTIDFPLPRSSFHRKTPPLSLGWVCKRWRTILYATPQLWDTLEICWPHPRHWNTVIKDWLKRSTELPLTLVYKNGLRIISDQDIEVLKSVSHRCQDVTLDLTFPFHLLAPLKGSFQKLQSLTVTSSVGPKCDVFLDAPHLHIFRTTDHSSLRWITIPRSQLTEFVGLSGHWDVEDCIALIQDCPNLVLCTFPSITSYNSSAKRLVTIHGRLQMLAITHSQALIQFFQATSFPSLRELRLNGSITRSYGIQPFKDLNPEFWEPIQRVCFENPSMTSAMKIPPLLRLMPSLIEIEIHQPPDRLSIIFDSFVPNRSRRRPPLAPFVLTLTIGVTQPETIDDWDRAAFIRMLRNRCQIPDADPSLTTTLKLVRVKGPAANELVDKVQVEKEGLGDYIEVIEHGSQDW